MAHHRLSQIDTEARRAVCSVCGPVPIQVRWTRRNGTTVWRCVVAKRGLHKRYRRELGDRCERCGFVAEHPSQLDVHHADGDHSNDAPDNLVTLCANCHRLKHALS